MVVDHPPGPADTFVVFPVLGLLILALFAWLDQRIWPPARPLAQSIVGFRTVLATVLSLLLLTAFLAGTSPDRVDETKVLPLPPDLTLASRTESCGSQVCGVTYTLATPDGVPIGELSARLWRHLESRGWQRQRANATCRDIGWLHSVHQCLFLGQRTPGVATLDLTTALDLSPMPD
jgi:hypothetical protein